MKIIISHGSGGIGSAELICKEYLEHHGFNVELNDYFSRFNMKRMNWSDSDEQDCHNFTFKDLCELDIDSNQQIVHIGFSLGAFVGLVNNDKFFKNYMFYPGLIGFTQEMTQRDYSNATVYFGSEDPGKEKFDLFLKKCTFPPLTNVIVSGAHHAFMTKDVDRTINMVRYNNLRGRTLSEVEFSNLKPNHTYMANKYGYKTNKRILRSDDMHRNNLLNILVADLKNHL